MIRVNAVMIAVLAFAVGWSSRDATVVWPASYDYPTRSDVFHNTCIEAELLDDPRIWTKGSRPPPVCLPPETPRDPDVFADAWGRELDLQEWASVSYRWFRHHRPARVLFVGVPDVVTTPENPPAVPVPWAGALLLGGLGALAWAGTWQR